MYHVDDYIILSCYQEVSKYFGTYKCVAYCHISRYALPFVVAYHYFILTYCAYYLYLINISNI